MLYRKKYILAKIESTYATDPTASGANAIQTSNLQINPQQGNRVNRNLDKPTLGNSKDLATGRYTTISFDVEIAGSGAAGTAPPYGPLLQACAMAEAIATGVSVTYTPESDESAMKSVTIDFRIDGELHKLTGARGTVEVVLNKEQIPVYRFTFTGIHNDPTSPALIAPDYSAFQDPLPVTDTNTPTYTVDTFDVKAESLTVNFNNAVTYRNVVNSESVRITGRDVRGQIVFEQEDVDDKDFYAIDRNETAVAINVVHGTATGNIVQITASQAQLMTPQLSDSDGISIMTMAVNYTETATSGDDEISIVVK